MQYQEDIWVRFWTLVLVVFLTTAAFLTTAVYPIEVTIAYLTLLIGVVAIGLLTNVWGGLIISAVSVFAIVLINQYLGIYPRENLFINIATQLAVFLIVGPLAGHLATIIAKLHDQMTHWLAEAEILTVHDDLFGTLKSEWALVRLEEERVRAERNGRLLTIVLLQLHPHPISTAAPRHARIAALQALVRNVRALTQTPEFVTYLGNDQLLLVLPEQTQNQVDDLLSTLINRFDNELYYPDETAQELGRPLREWGDLQIGLSALSNETRTVERLLEQAKSNMTTHISIENNATQIASA